MLPTWVPIPPRPHVAALAVGVTAACLSPAIAEAGEHDKTRTIRAATEQRGAVTFEVQRRNPSTIRAARLLTGDVSRRLRVRTVRDGARRGELRVNLSPEQRRAMRPARAGAFLKLTIRGRTSTAPPAPDSSTPPSPTPTVPDPPTDSGPNRLYSDASPFNQRIPQDATVDPRSSTMVQSLVKSRRQKDFPLSVGEWTVPVYYADRDTPRYDVKLRKAPPDWTDFYGTPSNFIGPPPGWITDPDPWRARLGDWETATPKLLNDVPIPPEAKPDPELDSHMSVIDRSTGCEYDFYAAHKADGGWQAIWANSTRIDGSGVYPQGLSSKASGFAGAAGLVWPEELRAGRIDHALFFSYPYTKAGGPVAPATSSDAKTESPEAIPEGARVQLDPDLDLDSLNLEPYERTVARALQEYGMILGDTGGATGLFAVHRQSYETDPYEGVLPEGPYAYLSNIPTDRFRVLELPEQQSNLSLELDPSGCGTFG